MNPDVIAHLVWQIHSGLSVARVQCNHLSFRAYKASAGRLTIRVSSKSRAVTAFDMHGVQQHSGLTGSEIRWNGPSEAHISGPLWQAVASLGTLTVYEGCPPTDPNAPITNRVLAHRAPLEGMSA